jgi:hypothetical protein
MIIIIMICIMRQVRDQTIDHGQLTIVRRPPSITLFRVHVPRVLSGVRMD